jgi:hypothetical protein
MKESTFVTERQCEALRLLFYNKKVQDSKIGSEFDSSDMIAFYFLRPSKQTL